MPSVALCTAASIRRGPYLAPAACGSYASHLAAFNYSRLTDTSALEPPGMVATPFALHNTYIVDVHLHLDTLSTLSSLSARWPSFNCMPVNAVNVMIAQLEAALAPFSAAPAKAD